MGKHRLTILAGLALAVTLMWWALHDVSIAEVWHNVLTANPWLLTASVGMATGTFVMRAFRWRVLLLPALSESSFHSRFSAVCIGFAGNNLLPARLGEFARVAAFSRMEPIGLGATFASLVLERLFDALILVIFLLPALYLPGFAGGQRPSVAAQVIVPATLIVLAALIFLSLLVRFPNRALQMTDRWLHRLLPTRLADPIAGLLASFIEGLGALRHAHVFFRVIGWSILVWLWNAGSFWVGFLAFDITTPGLSGALLLQSVVGFAVSLPSSPGFFGPFEAASRVALVAYGVGPTLIISFAAGYHILSFIPVTLFGLYYAHRLGISWREVERSEEVLETSSHAPEPDESV
jgi:uncharacterized protein (TIRG00374 family)